MAQNDTISTQQTNQTTTNSTQNSDDRPEEVTSHEENQMKNQTKNDTIKYQYTDIKNRAFEESNCYKCLSTYEDAYYCSTADSSLTYQPVHSNMCCGSYEDEFLHLKPLECYSIPEAGYKCSNEFNLHNVPEIEAIKYSEVPPMDLKSERYQKYLKYT